jgi:arginine N-succinyltransferase
VSERSFSGAIAAPEARRYIFVLYDGAQERLVGTSTLVAQLGQPDAPYIYVDVLPEEKYSTDLDLHFHHRLLRLGFSYNGPTELAGLVVDPHYRGHRARLGLSISYIRFLFIAANRQLFQTRLLAELLPPLEPDGTSHVWNAFGRRFTGMSYRDADRLSHENKDFIRDLFPSDVVYASLFDNAAQRVLGKVGEQTLGVEKMLRRAGFQYANRIDPFDGGPHFVANVDATQPIIDYRHAPVKVGVVGKRLALLAQLSSTKPYVRCRIAEAEVSTDAVVTNQATIDALNAVPNDLLHALPLP